MAKNKLFEAAKIAAAETKENKKNTKSKETDNNTEEPKKSTRSVRLINDNSNFAVREAYKALRTNIVFALPENDSNVILITSSWPLEGKTTNCANLAVVFSQMGEKTLLIDADLRKPRIHKIFKLNSKIGLSNVLRNLTPYEEAIQHTNYSDLDILSSGHIPPNPAELLASEEMKKLLEKLKKTYKYILIDTPPVNMVSDALVLSPVVSGIVMVVRQSMTVHKSVTEALEKINFAGAKVLGFILNDSIDPKDSYYSNKKSKSKKYYYKNYYKNYYGYYGSYGSTPKNNEGTTN